MSTGKPAATLRSEEEAVYAAQTVTVRCLFCPWTYVCCAGEASTIATSHRLEQHPDLRPRRRRKTRISWNPSFQMHPQDEAEIEAERIRRAFLNGVELTR